MQAAAVQSTHLVRHEQKHQQERSAALRSEIAALVSDKVPHAWYPFGAMIWLVTDRAHWRCIVGGSPTMVSDPLFDAAGMNTAHRTTAKAWLNQRLICRVTTNPTFRRLIVYCSFQISRTDLASLRALLALLRRPLPSLGLPGDLVLVLEHRHRDRDCGFLSKLWEQGGKGGGGGIHLPGLGGKLAALFFRRLYRAVAPLAGDKERQKTDEDGFHRPGRIPTLWVEVRHA
mmetsp:Transcript_38890/g.92992  ORF Transcript_38890/g.92992 Transcript_38890/m.92992 type:complete len:230 (+) Transcript_38890:1074-1763(+)